MNASEKRVFHFHADANPIGGRIVLPVDQFLPSQGSAALAQAGGHSAGRVGPHRIDGIVSFDSAHSEVFGFESEAEKGWTTTVSSVVEGLNILDIVRADALVTRIKLNHPFKGGHPSVSFGGTHFFNLTVEGKPITPEFDLDTFARTAARAEEHGGAWQSDDRHFEAAVAHNRRLVEHEDAPKWVKNRYNWMAKLDKNTTKGRVVCSLVKQIAGAPKGSAYGHILHVPDVGNLFLGEISVSQGMFRVTLLRAEMGCQAEGDLSAGGGGAGGLMMMDDTGGNQTLPG